MKVTIKPYVNYMRWSYQILEKLDPVWKFMFKNDKAVDEFKKWVAESYLGFVLDWYGEKYNEWKESRRVNIHIDNYDTWSMDSTLTPIILPMLKQLKESKHGAPFVDDKDVPKILRSYNDPVFNKDEPGATDKYFFRRWDWVMDEMIWAFEAIQDNYPEDLYDSMSIDEYIELRKEVDDRIQKGLILFGKYFRSLWD